MVVFGGGGGGEAEEEEREKEVREEFIMAVVPERSRTLHNFSFPYLKWGKQKQLRCVRVTDGANQFSSLHRGSPQSSSSSAGHRDSGEIVRRKSEPERKKISFFQPPDKLFGNWDASWSPALEVRKRSLIDGGDFDNGMEAVRAKLMLDFQTKIDRMKGAILSERGSEDEIEPLRTTDAATEIRPWSLRTRRGSVQKESDMKGGGRSGNDGEKCLRVDERGPDSSPLRNDNKLQRLRSVAGGRENTDCNGGEKGPRAKFSVALSKQEIETDFMAIAGIRRPRRPTKRPKHVQRQLDELLPGFWLSEITPDMYKVNENLVAGKK
ncbi:hypothetical protein Ancab_018515 [Ancistrocladus abbreviatus]